MAQTVHEIATNEIPKGASGRPGTLDDSPYRWDIIEAPLAAVANTYPLFKNGLPDYVRLQNVAAPKKLTRDFAV
jgi:hypothetical protein